MELIIYKNGRKYSNIKFPNVNECIAFIKFYGVKANDIYNIFEYPSGEFYTQYFVDDSNELCIYEFNDPKKKPRKRRF